MFLVRAEEQPLTGECCKRMCLPRRFWDATLDKIPDEYTYKKTISKYCAKVYDAFGEGIGLYLSGQNKSGKTASASIVAKAARSHNATVYFTTAGDLVRHQLDRAMYDHDQSVQDRVADVNMLVLDSLGGEQPGPLSADIIRQVVRKFYHDKRLLVITTSLKQAEVLDRYGEDFHKTICSCTLGVVVNGDWASYAQQQIKDFIEG